MGADRLVHLVSNKTLEAKLVICQKRLTTGVTGVGEFVEISDGTQEIHNVLNGLSIQGTSAEHKALEMMLWKSESAIVVMKQGNACGAKGWQIERA